MITKLRGFAKDSFLYGLGDGLGRMTSLILLPILSRVFVPADYGVIDLLSVSYSFLLMVFRLNMMAGLQRHYYQTAETGRQVLVSSVTFSLVLIAFFFALLILPLSFNLSYLFFKTYSYRHAIVLLAFCLPLEILLTCLLLLLRLNRKAMVFSFSNILRVVSTTLITYYCVVTLSTGIIGVFIAKTVSLAIMTAALVFYQRHEFAKKIDFKMFKKLFVFSVPGHPGLMIKSGMGVLPRYILTYYSSLSVVGLYGIAFRIAIILDFFINSFNRAWNPFAFYNRGKSDEKSLYQHIFKVYAASLIFLGMTLSLFSKEVLLVLTPSRYHSAYLLVGGLCFYIGMRGLVLVFSTALYSVNKVKFTSYLNFVQLLTFLSCAPIFVPSYHANGLILSLDIAILIYCVCYTIVTMAYFKFDIPYKRLLSLISISVPPVYIFNHIDLSFIQIFTFKCIFVLTFILLTYFILFTNEEKTQIYKGIVLPIKAKLTA